MLPNEKALNPEEETQQPNLGRDDDGGDPPTPTPMPSRKKMGITFDDAIASEPASSQSSSIYKEVLSQPPSTLSHKERLLWLQKRHTLGLWARCDDCNQWRYLSHVMEAHELPETWRCTMNPDKSYADCSVPETPLRVRDEADLIHNEYSAGSIVWARLRGYPWWPGIVDDDPETEQYYWLDGFSDIPTHYNVTFFDEDEVTHAWIAPNQIKPYEKNRAIAKTVSKEKKYKKRLGAALTQAEDACRLSLQNRLSKYSFLTRYSGSINSPKKVTKSDLKPFNDRFMKRYNVQLECPSDMSEDEYLETFKRHKKELPVKRSDVAAPKGKKNTEATGKKVNDTTEKRNATDAHNAVIATSEKPDTSKSVQISLQEQDVPQISRPENIETEEQVQISEKNDAEIAVNETPNENIASETVPEAYGSFDNDTSDTYVPRKDILTQSTYIEDVRQSINPDDTQSVIVPEDSDITMAETPPGRPQHDTLFGRKLEDSMEQFEETSDFNLTPASQESITPTPARVKPVFKPVFKTPNSLSVQVGTNATKASTFEPVDNDTSKTYVPGSESESESMETNLQEVVKNIQTRSTSGGSDDFDF